MERKIGFLKSFPKGINSSIDPLLLPPDQLSFATNATFRGDFAKQRPAFLRRQLTYESDQTRTDFQLLTAKFQGATYYRNPLNGYIMLAVGGKLFSISFSLSGNVLVSAITDSGAIPDPNPSIPGVPTGLALAMSGSSVSISWNLVAGATSYNVKRSTTSGSGYVSIGTNSTTNFIDASVVAGTQYFYVVSAFNIAGSSANSSEAQITTPSPNQPPDVPTGISSTSGNTIASIFWTASARASSYNVKRSTVSGSGYVTVGITSSTSFNDTGLSNGTTYYYVVSATNAFGESANSTQVSASPTVPPPQAPTNLAATAGNSHVSLTWDASAGATSYSILRSVTASGGLSQIGTSGTASYNDTTAVNGTTYYYLVTASNSSGESVGSNKVSATPFGSIPDVSIHITSCAASSLAATPTTTYGFNALDASRSTLLFTRNGSFNPSNHFAFDLTVSPQSSSSVTVGLDIKIYSASGTLLQSGHIQSVT